MVALSLFDAFVQGMRMMLNFCHFRSEVARCSPFEIPMHTGAHHSVAPIPVGVQLIHRDSITLERKYEQLFHGKTTDAGCYLGVCEVAIANATPTRKRSLYPTPCHA
jgi:hypothetical protein